MRSEPDDVEFRVATEVVTGTFSCAECAHGTAVRNEPLPRCPTCGGHVWEEEPADRRPTGVAGMPAR